MLTYLKKKMELPKEDAWSVFKGCLLACSGVAVVMLLEYATSLDTGKWSPVVAAVSSVLINYIRKKLLPSNENTNNIANTRPDEPTTGEERQVTP